MTKENFITKWAFKYNVNYTTNPYFIDDLEAVIAHEIAKVKKVKPEEQNGNCSTFDMSRLVDQDYKATEQFVKCICTNSLQVENCIRNCGHGEEPEQETVEPAEQHAKPFDKERFEAMFRAVIETHEATINALKQLDAYYATKEGGNNG